MYKGHCGQASVSKKVKTSQKTSNSLLKCLILFVQSQETFPPNINDFSQEKATET